MQTNAQRILNLLKEELALQNRHCRLLEDQQKALLACDHARFGSMQEEHALMLSLIDTQQVNREAAMRDDTGKLMQLSELIDSLPEKTRRAFGLVRDSLMKTVARIQKLSRENEQLIKNELEFIAFTLDLYVEAGRKADTDYGGYGALRSRMLLDRRA